MGKWNNRRWVPRRRYNDERPPSPPTYFQTKVNPQDILKSSLLSWEEKFCILAGVSWEKVVAAKKYIYCYDNVFKWNDTAGKDALFNAKERFWAMINGVPCDAPVPDPDMYIDKIDWNSKINPGLISDLDKEYFNPDEADNSAPDPTAGRNENNIGNGENPWESYCVQNTKDLKDVAQDWNRWGLKSKMLRIRGSKGTSMVMGL